MVLAVKIGNSTLSVGGFKDDILAFHASIETHKKATAFEYICRFQEILSFYKIPAEQISGAAICSVVPSLTTTVKNALQSLFGGKVLVISSGTKTGLKIKKTYSNLGTDIVCSSVAAIHNYPLPCLVISLGTATTFIAIDQEGCFLGSSITAGIQISLDALSNSASKLLDIELEAPGGLVGTSTSDSMKSGAVIGTACLVDGMRKRYQELFQHPLTCVITGQFADLVLPFCRESYEKDDFLLLKGIYHIYQKNTKV